MQPQYLDLMAADLLDAALAGLAEARTGIPPPGRRYTAHGRPVVDICEASDGTGQLSVYADPRAPLAFVSNNPRAGALSSVPRTLLIAPVATFTIEWWRCHPAFTVGGEIPDAADLDAAASMLLVDLWCMATQLLAEWRAGTLLSVRCASLEIGPVASLGPLGGAGGWSISVRAGLDDSAS